MNKNIKNPIKYFFFLLASSFLFYSEKVFASVDIPRGSLKISDRYDSTITRFSDVNFFLTSVIDFFLQFVGIIAIGAIIYGGFLMLTAGGEEEEHKKGLTVTLYACVGIVLILASYAIVNTVTSFGTGTEGTTSEQLNGENGTSGTINTPFPNGPNGVVPPAGSLNGGSDDYSKISANIIAQPTLGTVPMIVNFDTTGSFDLFNNELKKSDYFWDFDDDTVIMGVMQKNADGELEFEYNAQGDKLPIFASNELISKYFDPVTNNLCNDNKTLNLCLDFESARYYKQVADAASYYAQIEDELETTWIEKLKYDPGIKITDIITPAELAAIQKGKQIVDAIIIEKKYPVLLYGKIINTNGTPPDDSILLTNDNPGNYDKAIQILNPGSDGYVATLLNPYGVNLGYIQDHKYENGGNFAPKIIVANDSGTPFMPEDDKKSWQSVIVKVSRDNIDPNVVPPTAGFTYQFDEDDPSRIIFKNVSLTDKGANIMDLYDQTDDEANGLLDRDFDVDSDGDGNKVNDNDFFYFEWDFDIKDDASGDGNPNNDNEFKDNGIASFSADVIYNATANSYAITFNFKDNKQSNTTTPNYIIEGRDPESLTYSTIKSGSASPIVADISNLTKNIKYFRLKTSDGRKTAELKIKFLPSNNPPYEITPNIGITHRDVSNVYVKEMKSVMVKLMVKNLITQEYDSVVREVKIPNKKDLPKVLPTPLFTYQMIPGTTKVQFDNLSLDAQGEHLYRTNTAYNTTVSSINNLYEYQFTWDFDTKSEFDELLISPASNPGNQYIDPTGMLQSGKIANPYTRDSINDNDVHTLYNALKNGATNNPNYLYTMIVTFPEAGKTYDVKLTVYDTTDSGTYTATDIYDERVISIYVPPTPPPMAPIASFSWENTFGANSNSVSLEFKNHSLAYNFTNKDYYYISTSSIFDDIYSGNYDFMWDFDIDIDSNGDGNPKNDVDHTAPTVTDEIETPQTFPVSGIPAFSFANATGVEVIFFDDYKPHKVQLTVKNKITGALDSTVNTVQKVSPEIVDPAAAYIWAPSATNNNSIRITSKSRGIDNELIKDGNVNEYNFIIDADTNQDEDGDGITDNDNYAYSSADSFNFYLTYANFGDYNAKLTVIHKDSGKQDSITRKVTVSAPGAPLPPSQPMSAFTFNEVGDKQLQFKSVSLNRNGVLITSTTMNNIYEYTFLWDFDSKVDSNGNNDFKDDNNFSTNISGGTYLQGFQNLLEPLRYYGEYADDMNETDTDYGTRNVTLTVIEQNTQTGEKYIDTISRQVRLNNPPNIPRPIVNFTYSYTPGSADDSVEVYFNNLSKDTYGYPLNPANNTIVWDFNLNYDSDNDGNAENDIDNQVGDINPCIYSQIPNPQPGGSPIDKCIFLQSGDYPVRLTIINNGTNGTNGTSVSDFSSQIVKLRNAPLPQSPQSPSPIAAFTYTQSDTNDKEINFVNRAMTNNGTPIPSSNIIWDFDTSFDTNGDGNGGNDIDLFTNNDNNSFKVISISPIKVEYKKYKTYNVRQTVSLDSQVDFVTRQVTVGPLVTPPPSLPLFTYSKNGTTVNFVNKSLDGFGEPLTKDTSCAEGQNPLTNNCYKYLWYFDYQGTATSTDYEGFGPNLQFDYDEFGSYDVRLSIEDPNGYSEFMTRTIIIAEDSSSQTIKANIVATPKSGTAPLTVSFSSEGSKDELGSITNIIWDLDGDGSPDAGQGPDLTNTSYTYTKPGHYRVGLAIEGASGKALTYTWIDVYADPPSVVVLINNEKTNEPQIDPYIALANDTVNFDAIVTDKRATGTTTFSYIWNFDDILSLEPVSISNSADHTFANPGLYSVTLKVINNDTSLGTIVTRNIKVVPSVPEPKIIARDPNNVYPQSNSGQKFFSGALDILTNKFNIEFLASDSLGAPMTSACPNGPGCDRSKLEKFEWDFDDGQGTTELSKTTSVIHTFTKPGTYYVKLKATDEYDVFGEATKIVFIADPRKPVPVIDITPTVAKSGQIITFNATGSHSQNGPITSFIWKVGQAPFGQGAPMKEMFEKVSKSSFDTPGIYDVELTIKDNQGETTTVLLEDVIVIESNPPVAKLKSSLENADVPNVFLFDAFESFDTDPGDKIVQYLWDFGDGTPTEITTTPVKSHLYNNTGRYEAKVTVKDMSGLTNTAQVVSRVESLLVSKILNIIPTAGKAPLEVNFSGTGGNNKTGGIDDTIITFYEWDLKDGTILSGPNMKDITHTFMTKGKRNISLTVYDFQNNFAKSEKTIHIGSPDPAPLAIIDSGNIQSYRNQELTFDGSKSLTTDEIEDLENGTMDLEYSWNFGDNSPIVTDDWMPVHMYHDLGTFVVTLTVKDEYGRSSQDQIQLTIVKAKPQARFTADPSYGESVLMVHFDASTSSDPDNNIDYYLWRFSTNTVITTYENQIDHPFINNSTQPFTYNVLLKVYDEDGLADSYSLPITVLPAD